MRLLQQETGLRQRRLCMQERRMRQQHALLQREPITVLPTNHAGTSRRMRPYRRDVLHERGRRRWMPTRQAEVLPRDGSESSRTLPRVDRDLLYLRRRWRLVSASHPEVLSPHPTFLTRIVL